MTPHATSSLIQVAFTSTRKPLYIDDRLNANVTLLLTRPARALPSLPKKKAGPYMTTQHVSSTGLVCLVHATACITVIHSLTPTACNVVLQCCAWCTHHALGARQAGAVVSGLALRGRNPGKLGTLVNVFAGFCYFVIWAIAVGMVEGTSASVVRVHCEPRVERAHEREREREREREKSERVRRRERGGRAKRQRRS